MTALSRPRGLSGQARLAWLLAVASIAILAVGVAVNPSPRPTRVRLSWSSRRWSPSSVSARCSSRACRATPSAGGSSWRASSSRVESLAQAATRDRRPGRARAVDRDRLDGARAPAAGAHRDRGRAHRRPAPLSRRAAAVASLALGPVADGRRDHGRRDDHPVRAGQRRPLRGRAARQPPRGTRLSNRCSTCSAPWPRSRLWRPSSARP